MRYLRLAANDRAEEGVGECFVIRVGEGVDPDQAVYANVETWLLFELTSDCSQWRFALFDPSTRRTNRTFAIRCPGEEDSSFVVERDADGNRYRQSRHDPDALPREPVRVSGAARRARHQRHFHRLGHIDPKYSTRRNLADVEHIAWARIHEFARQRHGTPPRRTAGIANCNDYETSAVGQGPPDPQVGSRQRVTPSQPAALR